MSKPVPNLNCKEVFHQDCAAFVDFCKFEILEESVRFNLIEHAQIGELLKSVISENMKSVESKLSTSVEQIKRLPSFGMNCNMFLAVDITQREETQQSFNTVKREVVNNFKKHLGKTFISLLVYVYENCLDSVIINFTNIGEFFEEEMNKMKLKIEIIKTLFYEAYEAFQNGNKYCDIGRDQTKRFNGKIIGYFKKDNGSIETQEYRKTMKSQQQNTFQNTVETLQRIGNNYSGFNINETLIPKQSNDQTEENTENEQQQQREIENKIVGIETRMIRARTTMNIIDDALESVDKQYGYTPAQK